MRAVKIGLVSILAVGLLAGSTVGVAAQGVAVTGTLTPHDECSRLSMLTERCWGGSTDFDDPRLTGEYENTSTLIEDADEAGEGFTAAGWQDIRIANDEGSWSGRDSLVVYVSEDAVETQSGPLVLLGEGGYEGLAAVLRPDDTREEDVLVGIILEHDTE